MFKRSMLTIILFLSITGVVCAAYVIVTDKGYPKTGNGTFDLVQTANMAAENEFRFQIKLTRLGGNPVANPVWQLFKGTETAPGQFRVLMSTLPKTDYTLRGVSIAAATGLVDTIGPSYDVLFP